MVSDPPNESIHMRMIPVQKSRPCGLAPKTCSGLFDRFSRAAESMLNQELGLWCSGVPADPVVSSVAASRSCKATDIDSRNPNGWDNLSEGGSGVCSSDADTDSDTGHTSVLRQHAPGYAPHFFRGRWGYSREEQQNFFSALSPVEHISTCSLSSICLEDSTPVKSLPAMQARKNARKGRPDNRNQGVQQRVRRNYRKFGHTWLDVVRRGELCLNLSVRQPVSSHQN